MQSYSQVIIYRRLLQSLIDDSCLILLWTCIWYSPLCFRRKPRMYYPRGLYVLILFSCFDNYYSYQNNTMFSHLDVHYDVDIALGRRALLIEEWNPTVLNVMRFASTITSHRKYDHFIFKCLPRKTEVHSNS